jgi:mono/diheme cytochrome c family protein
MTQVGRRGFGLISIVIVAIVLMACGRATEEQIDQALGITPTATIDPTVSANETATAEAAELAVGSPGSGSAVPVAVTGNPTLGKSKFQFVCLMCHKVGGTGTAPDLIAPGGVGAGLTMEELTVIIREGTGHPPGPYADFQVTDADMANILAYILEQAGP